MAAGDVFRVTVKSQYTDAAIAVQHVLWFQQTSAVPIVGETEAVADNVNHDLQTIVGNKPPNWLRSPSIVWVNSEAQRMYPDAGAPATSATDAGVAGLGDDHDVGVPTVCSMVTTLRTAEGGRRGRGRIYLGGFAARVPNNPGFWADYFTVVDHSKWRSTLVADVLAWLNAFLARYDGTTDLDGSGLALQWGIFSRADAGAQVPPFPSNGFKSITAITCDGVIRIQRRREFGHGI